MVSHAVRPPAATPASARRGQEIGSRPTRSRPTRCATTPSSLTLAARATGAGGRRLEPGLVGYLGLELALFLPGAREGSLRPWRLDHSRARRQRGRRRTQARGAALRACPVHSVAGVARDRPRSRARRGRSRRWRRSAGRYAPARACRPAAATVRSGFVPLSASYRTSASENRSAAAPAGRPCGLLGSHVSGSPDHIARPGQRVAARGSKSARRRSRSAGPAVPAWSAAPERARWRA